MIMYQVLYPYISAYAQNQWKFYPFYFKMNPLQRNSADEKEIWKWWLRMFTLLLLIFYEVQVINESWM